MNKTLFLILFLSFLFVNCGSFGESSPHISDESLIKNFQENEGDFNLLIQMAKQDSNMIRIANDFTWTKDNVSFPRLESELGITNEHWEEYKKIFIKTKLKNGILNYQPDKVFLAASSQGMLTGGSSKGYAYLKEKPEILVNSLDDYKFEKSEENEITAYRKIADNWYLYYRIFG